MGLDSMHLVQKAVKRCSHLKFIHKDMPCLYIFYFPNFFHTWVLAECMFQFSLTSFVVIIFAFMNYDDIPFATVCTVGDYRSIVIKVRSLEEGKFQTLY